MKHIEVKQKGRPTKNPELFDSLKKLEKGKTTIITKERWTNKTKPGNFILERNTGKKFLVETLADESGWKVTALS